MNRQTKTHHRAFGNPLPLLRHKNGIPSFKFSQDWMCHANGGLTKRFLENCHVLKQLFGIVCARALEPFQQNDI